MVTMRLFVLGPLVVEGHAAIGRRDRVVLSALATRQGEIVTAQQLANALWGHTPPTSRNKVVQGCIVRLRKVLGQSAIETQLRGYRLAIAPDDIDSCQFESAIARAERLLATGEPERALRAADEALSLWRGAPFVEVSHWETGRSAALRLDNLRMHAEEVRLDAALRSGHLEDALASAVAYVEAAPTRERRWVLLATAHHHAGRHGDAERTLHEASAALGRDVLADAPPDLVASAAASGSWIELAAVAARRSQVPCPWPGLLHYGVDDHDDFFGRNDEVAGCLQRLASTGMLVVAGPAGSGKSSLVRAGVGAVLQRNGRNVVVTTPRSTQSLQSSVGVAASGARPVLVVDQCEEVFTPDNNADDTSRFLAELAAHAAQAPLIIALRADHIADLTAHSSFARIAERSIFLLGPMSAADVRSAIEGPAARNGLVLEPILVDLIVGDMADQRMALPLMSHALRETWLRRTGRTLTIAAYRKSGGVIGALAQTAETLYADADAADRPRLRDFFIRLVERTDGGEAPPRIPREAFAEDLLDAALVDRLVGARLVTRRGDTVEIAHEALVEEWPRLRHWLVKSHAVRVVSSRTAVRRYLAVALFAIVATLAVLVGVTRFGRPDDEVRRADARRVSAEALSATPLDRALLLAVEAVRQWDSPETRGNLLATIGRSPRLMGIIRGAARSLFDIELAPNGERAVVVDSLGDATQYGLADRRAIVKLSTEGFSYVSAAYAPDGGDLAVGFMADRCRFETCDEYGISVLDAGDLTTRRTDFLGLAAPPADIAYSDDGSLLAAAPAVLDDPEASITVWRVDQPDQPLFRLPVGDSGIELRGTPDTRSPGRVLFSPDGTQLYAGGAGATAVFDLATGETVRTFEGAGALALSPDGGTLAVRSSTFGVILGDTSTGDVIAELDGQGALATAAAFSDDGTRVATTGVDGKVIVWDAASGARLFVLDGHAAAVLDVVFSRDGSALYTSAADSSMFVWSVGPTAGLTTWLAEGTPTSSPTNSVLVSPSADTVVVISDRVAVTVVDSRQVIELEVGEREVASADYSPDGQRLVTVGREGTTKLWDMRTGALIAARPGRGYANFGAVAFSVDGAAVVVAESDQQVVELDAQTLEPTGRRITVGLTAASIQTTVGGLVAVTWSPPDPAGGTEVLFGDLGSGQVTRRVHIASWSPRSAFSADGSRYAFGGYDGRLGVVDVANGKLVGSSKPVHTGPITGVAFSIDGSTLMSVSSDGELVLAEAIDAQPRARLRLAESSSQASIGFVPDGLAVVIGYGNGSVISLAVNAETWVEHACNVASRNLSDIEWHETFGDRQRRRTCPGWD
jgi:WD40 repeat protein/DNA-binding SARP family transcriptional activator